MNISRLLLFSVEVHKIYCFHIYSNRHLYILQFVVEILVFDSPHKHEWWNTSNDAHDWLAGCVNGLLMGLAEWLRSSVITETQH